MLIEWGCPIGNGQSWGNQIDYKEKWLKERTQL